MPTDDLEDALIQLAVAETALMWTTQTTGTWTAIESIRRARKALQRDAKQRPVATGGPPGIGVQPDGGEA